MKKFLLMTLACLLFASAALANSWGLRGGLLDIVPKDDHYKDYTADADDGNHPMGDRTVNHAILRSRYHAVLMAAAKEDGKWILESASTTAVYQPDDPRGQSPRLTHTGDGFTLAYGDRERYTFTWEGGDYFLTSAEYYVDPDKAFANSLTSHEGGYLFWQSGPGGAFLPIGDALLESDGIPLDRFNIAQMPRTLMEVRNFNMTWNALLEDGDQLIFSDVWQGSKNGKSLPVYAAPSADAYRAAKGKAAVSLKEEAKILAVQDGWTLIQYEVSPRTSRIGWVEGVLSDDAEMAFASTPLIAAADTFLTDDPLVSQFEQVQIPKGTALTGLSYLGEYYAYVAYQGDVLYCGFVPLKDLRPVEDRAWEMDAVTTSVRWDVMDTLCGKWFRQGQSWQNALILCTDGTWRQRRDGQDAASGNYRVYDSEDGGYDIILRTEANEEICYSLTLNGDGTICLDELVYLREEYSTFGNG